MSHGNVAKTPATFTIETSEAGKGLIIYIQFHLQE